MRLKDGVVATVALTARDEDEAAEALAEAAPEVVEAPPAIETAETGVGIDDIDE